MTFARWSVSLNAIIGALAATLAAATIWLLIADPVRAGDAVSTAVSSGDPGPFIRAIGGVLADALRGLFKYL